MPLPQHHHIAGGLKALEEETLQQRFDCLELEKRRMEAVWQMIEAVTQELEATILVEQADDADCSCCRRVLGVLRAARAIRDPDRYIVIEITTPQNEN